MRTTVIFTLIGVDRVGIVEEATRLLLARGGNVENSRMARLGGWFAMLMLVSVPADQSAALEQDLQQLNARGYQVMLRPAEPTPALPYADWPVFQIDVRGADHEGIVHDIAHYLAQRGINIESMDTAVTAAPMSGAPLFIMTALVAVPPALAGQEWQPALYEVAKRLNVDVRVSPARRSDA
ncbi:MAG: ACT domain-containing protein [Anaerolineae bacterium]|nr:hypothetical protein [Thermoflexales bacterium]MDW8407729.1 ACT domain-containing protein [Anaerolineae bacterium]